MRGWASEKDKKRRRKQALLQVVGTKASNVLVLIAPGFKEILGGCGLGATGKGDV